MIWDLVRYATHFTLLSACVALIFVSLRCVEDNQWGAFLIYATLASIMYQRWIRMEKPR